jgi:hypothetical protein
MSEAAPQAAANGERARSDWICRSCRQPVTLAGSPVLAVSLRRAVHTATLEERGPEGHLAAPIEPEIAVASAGPAAGERS